MKSTLRRIGISYAIVVLFSSLVPNCKKTQPPITESAPPMTPGEFAIAQLGRFDIRQYTIYADEILLTKTENLKSREITTPYGDRIIVSTCVLRIERAFKGDLKSDSTISIEFQGGTINDVTLKVSDAPSFDLGERAIVFIARGPTRRTVLGGTLGKLSVSEKNIIIENEKPVEDFAQEIVKYLNQ